MLENGWFRVIPVILEILEEEQVPFVRQPDGSYLRTAGIRPAGHVVSEYLPADRRSSARSPAACAPKGPMSSIIS